MADGGVARARTAFQWGRGVTGRRWGLSFVALRTRGTEAFWASRRASASTVVSGCSSGSCREDKDDENWSGCEEAKHV